MIRLDFPQRSPEWIAARLGIPTASRFSDILTPKTREFSKSSAAYMRELCVEWLLGVPADSGKSQWMERGTEYEDRAIAYYEWARNVTVERPGFCLSDDRSVGCSPDGLVGTDGGIEIKILSAANHVGVLLGATDDGYQCQVQGCMWITGAKWWDRVWWHPSLPSVIHRVERDEEFIGKLDEAITTFTLRLEEMKASLVERGCKPVERRTPEEIVASREEFDRLSAEETKRKESA